MKRIVVGLIVVLFSMLVFALPVMAQEPTPTSSAVTEETAATSVPAPKAEPAPALLSSDLKIESLRVEPQQVEEGGQPSIVVEVANLGTLKGSISLPLEIDGQVFETRTVSVAAGGREVTTFRAPSLSQGVHSVRVVDVEARYVVGGTENCTLRQGMQVRLQNVIDTITEDQDGHVELSFRNPPVNDCTVDADLRITVPSNIIPFAKEGISGTAGTLNSFVEAVPAGGERPLFMDFKCLKEGEYIIHFSGTYWPTGNKGLFQPISLQQRLTCQHRSGTLSFDEPNPLAASVDSPPPTAPSGTAEVAGSGAQSGTSTVDDFGLPLWLVALIIVGVLGLLVIAIVAIAYSRRGSKVVIRD